MADNFNIQNIKVGNCVEIKITKNGDDTSFNLNFKNLDNFKNLIRNNPKIIYELKYDPNNKYNSFNQKEELISLWEDDDKIQENKIFTQIEEELGFTNFIKYLSSKQIPLIGHNIYFDLLFIYDKFLSNLPQDFYTFKSSLHKYFPLINDTKTIYSNDQNFENKTNLEILYKTIQKKKYDIYVKFEPDVENGFNQELNYLHNAGYDGKITGECFVLMNKAMENNYLVNNNDISKSTNKKKKKLKMEDDNISNIGNIKYGFCCMNLFDKFENVFHMSLVDHNYGKINLNINQQSKEDYLKNENDLINNVYKNVFVAKFKNNNYLIGNNILMYNNYEIANFFKNEKFNLNVIKIDFDKFFVEFYLENNNDNNDINDNIKDIIDNKGKNEKLIVKEIFDYKDFITKLNII